MWDGADFAGAKIALICDGELIAYKRDLKPCIPYPGLWDLPGGGREGEETPDECAIRETREEFGIVIDPDSIHWRRRYPSSKGDGQFGWLLVARVTREQIGDIVFGDEGERWEMMVIDHFLHHPEAIPSLKQRLADYLCEQESAS
jgi:8-oxo-dGTP diphosphatase